MAVGDFPWLEWALGHMGEDWLDEWPDQYVAAEEWVGHREASDLAAVISEIDRLFAEAPHAGARLALVEEDATYCFSLDHANFFDEWLIALRERCAQGLAGNPEPMTWPAHRIKYGQPGWTPPPVWTPPEA